GSVSAAENATAVNSGTFADWDSTVIVTASAGTLTQSGNQSGNWNWSGTGDEDSPYNVTVTATNANGSTATTTFHVAFTDVAPSVAADSSAVSAAEGSVVTNAGSFADFDDAVSIT